MNEVSHEALDLRYNSNGFLPDIGLYRRGDVFYHGPSRSHFWLFGILLLGAMAVALIPWHTRAVVGEVKYWIVGMMLLGGFCDLLGSLVQRAIRQQVLVDPKNRTVVIQGSGLVERSFQCWLSWDQIVELQICRQKVAGDSGLNGYQLILVWRETDGTVRRRCLLKHAAKGFVVRLGRRYESLFGFSVVDYTGNGQQDGAAKAASPRC